MATRSRSATTQAGERSRAPVGQRNLILSRLPDSDLSLLLKDSEVIDSALRDSLYAPDTPIDRVYFPITGMASLVTDMKDGTSMEAMTVGCEGFVGLPLFHGLTKLPTKAFCQIEGQFIALPAKHFTAVLAESAPLNSILHRYSQFASEVLTQSAACNALHLVEQRCARWLLTSADSIGKKKFNLTQEFLSQMLAVRRPGVTVAMGGLERQGLISHRYGEVNIIDVEGMRRVSCECYQTIRVRQRELLAE